MAFDPPQFEAQIALKLIPTEKLPSIAQDAMEAGFDGPCVVRMAILEPQHLWGIDQALPPMLAELGLQEIPAKDAALRVAVCRAEEILASGEDPLSSAGFFHRLMLAADHLPELMNLGYLEDICPIELSSEEEQREFALEELGVLVSPELRQQRLAERHAAELQRRQDAEERKRKLATETKPWDDLRTELLRERLHDLRRLWWLLAISWAGVAWLFGSWWWIVVLGAVLCVPALIGFARWSIGREVRRKRRDQLLRMGVPEELI